MARLLNRRQAPASKTLRQKYADSLREARAQWADRNGPDTTMPDMIWPPEHIFTLEHTSEPFGVKGWQIAPLIGPKTVDHYADYLIGADGRLTKVG